MQTDSVKLFLADNVGLNVAFKVYQANIDSISTFSILIHPFFSVLPQEHSALRPVC